jgi:dihydrofolate reductase
MRPLVVTENMTLDGVIDAEGGWFLPSGETQIDESDVVAALQDQAAASDGFLTGRVTFEEMRGYWPKQHDDITGITEHLNRVAKYVVSGTLTDPHWENTTVLSVLWSRRLRRSRHSRARR